MSILHFNTLIIFSLTLQIGCEAKSLKSNERKHSFENAVFTPVTEQPGTSSDDSTKWENFSWQLATPELDVAPVWYSITFATPLVGYALGGPDWNVGEGKGSAYLGKTIDGGKSWEREKIPETYAWMRGITCEDENNCWIAGCSAPKIRLTHDGGTTWQGATDNYGWPGCLWSISYTGTTSSVLAGTTGFADEVGRRASMLRSVDGTNFDALIASDAKEYVAWDIHCPSPGVCFSAAKTSTYITKDNGATLARVAVPKDESYSAVNYGVWCIDDNTCWQVGGSSSGEGQGVFITMTTDAGENWVRQSTELTYQGRPRLWNVQMIDANTGYAVGCKNAPDNVSEKCEGEGIILYTEDGALWQEFVLPTDVKDIADLWVFGKNDLIIMEWNGKTWRGSFASE